EGQAPVGRHDSSSQTITKTDALDSLSIESGACAARYCRSPHGEEDRALQALDQAFVNRYVLTGGKSALAPALSSADARYDYFRRRSRRDAEPAQKLLQQILAHLRRHFVKARAFPGAKEKLVAGQNLVDEAERQRFAREPMVPVGDGGNVEAGPALGDVGLERFVGGVELAAEMLAACGRDLAQHRHRALPLAGRHFLEVDLVLLEEPVQVRHRRDDAD